MESKGIVEQIVVQNSNNQDEVYDIAASGQNVSYNEDMNVVEKIDEIANQIDGAIDGKVNLDGGSLANTVAGDVTSQGSVSEIISTDRGSTIWGKINAIISNLRRKVDSDGGSLENTKAGSISPTSLSSITSSDKGSVIWGKINSLITKTNNIETSLNNKIDKSGGSVANATAGYVNTQSSSTDINSSDTLSTIWGKFNKLREEIFTNHKYSTVYRNSTNLNKLGGPPHGIKYQDGSLQIYVPNNTSSASTQDAGVWKNIRTLPKLVSWTNGTDDEIVAMLDAHYNNLLDVDCFWAIGDQRKISLSAMLSTGGYVNETHISQTINFTILDFNHDTLVTPVNNRTKAAITIQQKDCLCYGNPETAIGASNRENGVMNVTRTNEGGWHQCNRRAWCNNIYYNAIPNPIKSYIKLVYKETSNGKTGTSKEITTDQDKVFLLSAGELGRADEDGFIYSYMDITKYPEMKGYYKLPKYNSSSDSGHLWFIRTPSSDPGCFFSINDSNIATVQEANSTNIGIAPAFCL